MPLRSQFYSIPARDTTLRARVVRQTTRICGIFLRNTSPTRERVNSTIVFLYPETIISRILSRSLTQLPDQGDTHSQTRSQLETICRMTAHPSAALARNELVLQSCFSDLCLLMPSMHLRMAGYCGNGLRGMREGSLTFFYGDKMPRKLREFRLRGKWAIIRWIFPPTSATLFLLLGLYFGTLLFGTGGLGIGIGVGIGLMIHGAINDWVDSWLIEM